MAVKTLKKTNTKEEQVQAINIVTPVGAIVYKPKIVEVDEMSKKYAIVLKFPKEVFKAKAAPMVKAVVDLAREFYGNPKMQLKDFNGPFKDGDATDKEWLQGHILLKSYTKTQPTIVDAQGQKWDKDEYGNLKAGDFVRLVCSVNGWKFAGKTGVSAYMNVIQFAAAGKFSGAGVARGLEMLAEEELELDDIPEDVLAGMEGSDAGDEESEEDTGDEAESEGGVVTDDIQF